MRREEKMKMHKIFQAVLLMVGTALFIWTNLSCQISFVEELHERDDFIMRRFDMLTYESEDAVYHIEKMEKEAATELVQMAEEVILDIRNLSSEKEWKKPELYFVNNSSNEIKNNENLFCIDITLFWEKTEEIKKELLYWQYPCDYWISYALSHEEEKIDIKRLKDYYADVENQATLSLFGARFFPEIVGEEQTKIVEDTAIALWQFAKQQNGQIIENLLVPQEEYASQYCTLVNGWLKSLGLTAAYENSYETGYLIRFYEQAEEVIICLQNIEIHCPDYYYDIYVENIDELEAFLCLTYRDVLDMKAYLAENQGSNTKLNLDKKILCNKQKVNVSKGGGNHIILNSWVDFMHELLHCYSEACDYYDIEKVWLDEGLAEYVGTVCFSTYYENKINKMMTERVQKTGNVITIASMEEMEKITLEESSELLLQILKRENDSSRKMLEKMYEYSAKFSLFCPVEKEYKLESGITLEAVSNGKVKDYWTSDWTYEECERFVAYLIECYGMKQILYVVQNYEEFETILGKSPNALYEEWKQIEYETLEKLICELIK